MPGPGAHAHGGGGLSELSGWYLPRPPPAPGPSGGLPWEASRWTFHSDWEEAREGVHSSQLSLRAVLPESKNLKPNWADN